MLWKNENSCRVDESRSRHYRKIKTYRPDEVSRADEWCEKFSREKCAKKADIFVV